MKRQPDWPALLLLIAILFGGLVRFMPALMTRFPINDGGMFYTMAGELTANGYALPATTSYNGLDLPFAYPPFGIYLASLLADVGRIPPLGIFLWLPPILATLAIPAFYLLSRALLADNLRAALATLFFALTPGRYDWHLMGGGVTRAAGMLFLLLAAFYVLRLFQWEKSTSSNSQFHASLRGGWFFRRSNLLGTRDCFAQNARNDGWLGKFESNYYLLIFAILFSSLAVLSHPEVGLQTFGICAILWLFFGRTRRSTLHALLISICVSLLTAPWWGTVIAYHGLSPFLSALQTGQHATTEWFPLLVGLFVSAEFLPLLLLLRLAGFFYAIWKKQYLLIVLVFVPALLDPRSAASIALLSFSMLAALGFLDALPALIKSVQAAVGLPPASTLALGASARGVTAGITRSALISRASGITLLLLAFTLFLECGLLNFRLVNTTLTADEREAMTWLRENLPPNQNFLLVTGRQYSMSDPVQEWFPTLTGHHSQTTLQGLEWTLGAEFTDRLNDLVALQACADLLCVDSWVTQTGLPYDTLWLSLPPQNAAPSFQPLLDSIRASNHLHLIHETNTVLIFQRTK